ncbi:MAG: hypothetical protein HRT93_07020 [Piscirickettsiaceae bacterium]|nr:hypothetical protein [Piscirickettsiaceae bacterium]
MKNLKLKKIVMLCGMVLLVPMLSMADISKTDAKGTMDYVKSQAGNAPSAYGKIEGSQVLNASEIVPNVELTGSNYLVKENVFNDGFMNHYTIESTYGPLTVVSTAKLHKRIHEFDVISEIESISKEQEFIDGMAEKGKDVVVGVKNIITSPIDSLSGAVSGVGKLFQRAGENITGQARSDQESRLEDLSGYAKTKRDYASQLNVDVYSRNLVLQEQLDSLTKSGYTGNMLAALSIGAFTGPVVTTTGATNLLNKVIADMAPADLRKMNREKLTKMGVLDATADAFIANGSFTPREQTVLVNALAEMSTTEGRQQFIKTATNAVHYDVTYFRQVQAEMYASHSRNIAPLKTFTKLGPFVAAVTEDNIVVVNLPMDYMLWTEAMAKSTQLLSEYVNNLEWVTGQEMYFTGSVSPLARENLTNLGWEVIENTSAL